jgi:hypothetical protein
MKWRRQEKIEEWLDEGMEKGIEDRNTREEENFF